MDPDTNLTDQLQLVEEITGAVDDPELPEDLDDYSHDDLVALAQNAVDLAELVGALHGWISRGGFLPSSWRARKKAYQPPAILLELDGKDLKLKLGN